MLFERIESEGLAHYSYLIGDTNKALVIDPRRDCDIYIDKAEKKGFQIKTILETHRNEDYVIGSLELAERTGAQIWHADTQLDYQYGNPVEDKQTWKVGRYEIEAISTPGHTPGHMSYLLKDPNGIPWMVFTGDALFAGDIGRVDLMGKEKAQEMAGMLYDSIFKKLLPLGDEVIVCPAHGAGSVCGSSIAERIWTTIGIERKNNPKLQYDNKKDFIKNNAVELERPPYFRRMEKWNMEGPPLLKSLPVPTPLSPGHFAHSSEEGTVVDTRMELGFGAAHVPESISLWSEGLPGLAGWFLEYEKPIYLVQSENDPMETVSALIRLGYDNIQGYLSGGMLSWHMSGRKSDTVETLTVHEFCGILDKGQKPWILDVRSAEELEEDGKIPGAHHIHITQLPEKIRDVPLDKKVCIFCGSGLRSMTAASILKKEGIENPAVILGGLMGWDSATCPIEL